MRQYNSISSCRNGIKLENCQVNVYCAASTKLASEEEANEDFDEDFDDDFDEDFDEDDENDEDDAKGDETKEPTQFATASRVRPDVEDAPQTVVSAGF